MSSTRLLKDVSGLCMLLCGLLSSVCGQKVSESPGKVQELRSVLTELTEEVRAFLGSMIGEQTVNSVNKAFSQVVAVVAGGLASGLNILQKNLSHLLEAAGLTVNLPVQSVTTEGVIFVGQWLILALIGYWLLSLALQLVASTLRQALWLLKLGLALGCFGLILSDSSATSETTAVRLAVLVFVCVLLGVGRGQGSVVEDKTAHLEEQVRILERKLREMERWRRTEE
ncbi:transmembrane protein 109 [Cheilinus undulatus]|uniref:transmembrane protein 109 n=1 Tax=Cheilinus undulatus TaxID=241271 RepID=UPI001BD34911|nr:transmembrane protein 109 [Cheilinus undulatus]